MSDTYKPTEHDGLKQDGTPDKRVGTGEFAQGKVDPHEAGQQGGATSGSGDSSSGGSGGSGSGQFAHGKVDPVEAGKKGGNS
ncbi:Nn.00g066370.m01.CDS01 [Neocucurbitaria sp. VM-36]